VVFTVISLVYDLVYLLFILKSEAIDAEFGDIQKSIRKFSLFTLWISLAFRPIIILVLWKDSLDFRKILKQKIDEPATNTSVNK